MLLPHPRVAYPLEGFDMPEYRFIGRGTLVRTGKPSVATGETFFDERDPSDIVDRNDGLVELVVFEAEKHEELKPIKKKKGR